MASKYLWRPGKAGCKERPHKLATGRRASAFEFWHITECSYGL